MMTTFAVYTRAGFAPGRQHASYPTLPAALRHFGPVAYWEEDATYPGEYDALSKSGVVFSVSTIRTGGAA